MSKLDAEIKHYKLLIINMESKLKRMQDDINAWKHRLSQKMAIKNKQQEMNHVV